ncbi:hypothetical protein [Microcoleus sp. FACHB-68]|uniref:hypothetical protein n=1 Tax=Microcoleus sp. FACHB-68 TaxID=2692826 RepID=UPI00168998E8|nr:hypothetical protein [Microcoleus sp. FACHB-68]MBD1935880.1 hypothetical protein [Microcoleus sp. FACHB-68]
MTEVLPTDCLNYLPLSAEAFSSWKNNSDIQQLLYCVFDKEYVLIAEDGSKKEGNYQSYGEVIYSRGKSKISKWIEILNHQSGVTRKVDSKNPHIIFVPDFYQDQLFGKAGKYMVAWDGIISELLSEGAFVSLPHVLESQDDIEASFLLMSRFYYRHSVQVLRGLLESTVLQTYFAVNRSEFEQWKKNNYRTPRLRGNGGLIHRLLGIGLIPNALGNEICNLYEDFNGYVHSGERHLIHRDVFVGKWIGHEFKNDEFQKWCSYFFRVMDVCIQLMIFHVNQWNDSFDKDYITCKVCHSTTDFDLKTYVFGGEKQYEYTCKHCSDVSIYGKKMKIKS